MLSGIEELADASDEFWFSTLQGAMEAASRLGIREEDWTVVASLGDVF
jgi:hypothetical protein